MEPTRRLLDKTVDECQTLNELKRFAELLVAKLSEREIVLLIGPMGAGKTQLVRFVLEAFSDPDQVCSPSFAVHNHYETKQKSVDHIDLYRLENEDDLESTGFWDLFANPDGLIMIEWADRLNLQALPEDWPLTVIQIDVKDAGSRLLTSHRYAAI